MTDDVSYPKFAGGEYWLNAVSLSRRVQQRGRFAGQTLAEVSFSVEGVPGIVAVLNIQWLPAWDVFTSYFLMLVGEPYTTFKERSAFSGLSTSAEQEKLMLDAMRQARFKALLGSAEPSAGRLVSPVHRLLERGPLQNRDDTPGDFAADPLMAMARDLLMSSEDLDRMCGEEFGLSFAELPPEGREYLKGLLEDAILDAVVEETDHGLDDDSA